MRQYISQKNPDINGLLSIIGKDFRYLRNVLRISTGDMIYVRLPDGKLQNMTVAKIDESSKKIVLQICADTELFEGENQPQVQNKIEFLLFMFVPKSSKFDLIVRQATECGISRIIPVVSEFSQNGAEKMNFRGERFERIIKEARQQSGSAVETKVCDCVSVEKMCEIWKNETSDSKFGCVLYERSDKTVTLKKALCTLDAEKLSELKKCALVCGAEGGISPSEIELLSQHGFIPVHFETNILRCETAALYGIAALQSALTE